MELNSFYQMVDRGVDLAEAFVQGCCITCRCCPEHVAKSRRTSAGPRERLTWGCVMVKIHMEVVHLAREPSEVVRGDVCRSGSWNNGRSHVAAKFVRVNSVPMLHSEAQVAERALG